VKNGEAVTNLWPAVIAFLGVIVANFVAEDFRRYSGYRQAGRPVVFTDNHLRRSAEVIVAVVVHGCRWVIDAGEHSVCRWRGDADSFLH